MILLRHVFSGILSPDFWDSRPIALNLETAWQDATKHKWFTDLALDPHAQNGAQGVPLASRFPSRCVKFGGARFHDA